jgi:hypothetical protein
LFCEIDFNLIKNVDFFKSKHSKSCKMNYTDHHHFFFCFAQLDSFLENVILSVVTYCDWLTVEFYFFGKVVSVLEKAIKSVNVVFVFTLIHDYDCCEGFSLPLFGQNCVVIYKLMIRYGLRLLGLLASNGHWFNMVFLCTYGHIGVHNFVHLSLNT